MSDEIFQDMARQMRPSDPTRQALFQALAQEGPANSAPNGSPDVARRRIKRPKRARILGLPRRLVTPLAATVAAAAMVSVALLPAVPWANQALRGDQDGSALGGRTAPAREATVTAAGYDQVYQAVETIFWHNGVYGKVNGLRDIATGLFSGDWLQGQVMPEYSAMSQADSTTVGSVAADAYTATNTQVEGIDEGDVVKTDGQLIFAAAEQYVTILRAAGADTEVVSKIDVADIFTAMSQDDDLTSPDSVAYSQVIDLLIYDNVLVVLIASSQYGYGIVDHESDVTEDDLLAGTAAGDQTVTLIYDVSQPTTPRHLTTLAQSGYYTTSRLLDGTLYVVTNHSLWDIGRIDPAKPGSYVPCVADPDGTEPIPVDDISLLPDPASPSYAVATATDLKTGQRIGQEAILGGAETVYLTASNLYLAGTRWVDPEDWDQATADPEVPQAVAAVSSTKTDLVRISLDDADLSVSAQTTVDGRLLNQFSLDEFEGYLRLVTTSDSWVADETGVALSEPFARLEILNPSLVQVGSIDQLVTNESVQAVRFIGQTGYVVTFRQVDPLFAIDLKDPTTPRVLSALKIPGFSTYLHPWGEGLLLGLGQSATDDGAITGLKLSMFDISDPAAVSEVASLALEGLDHSSALNDHHAILVDQPNNLIGFGGGSWETMANDYWVYSYGPDGFEISASLPGPELDYEYSWYGETIRGIRIGDDLYVCSSNETRVYSIGLFDTLTTLEY
ncbi:MAG: beta-propeller domain-containing protein [Bifidobacteriaceae bacterium]|jgi:uncharacterized secreted protein with C-terminal beta-propeller domain|nr:beta-propeller domain-containing protein [Bifidobacteriaceae bacterium]